MKYYNLMDISLSQLVVFQSAASLKNFTKTANQLSITQPAVSKSIAGLEQALGISLFVRTKNHMLELTPAGELLYDYCSNLIPDMYQILNRIQLVSTSGITTLKIGANVDARNDDYLLAIIKKFSDPQESASAENFEPLIRLMSCTDLFHSVRDRKLDAAILCTNEILENDMNGLCYEELIQIPMAVYIHSSNPLFYRDSLVFDDIIDQPLILFQSGRKNNTHTDKITHLLMERGVIPNVGFYVNHSESVGFHLCLGKGIFIADEFFRLPYNPQIRAFYLRDIGMTGLSVIYREENLSPSLRAFLNTAKNYFSQEYVCPFHIRG